jgi:hypothetical protein
LKGGFGVRIQVLVKRDNRTEIFFQGVSVGMALTALWVNWLR